MGYYINPPNEEKETWLEREAECTPSGPCEPSELYLPVCLVDNGMFTAAGIAYDSEEVKAFNRPSDVRPKKWYRVERAKLATVSNLPKRYTHLS